MLAVAMVVRLRAGENGQRSEIHGEDERHDRDHEIENEELRFAVGLVLLREKIHFKRDGVSPSQN